jgi:plastocyanin
MRILATIAVVSVLACGSAHVLAKDWNVSVGGYTMSGGDYYGGGTTSPTLAFNPPNLTINAGDTVTFTNLGGVAVAHNVHADDDSFRCANGCRGVGGATGDPSSAQWSSTVTFTKAGVVNFHCDDHGGMGMTGSITVNAVAAVGQSIKPGISGNWDDPTPNQGGHGFQFEILPNNGMLAIWFVFNPAGTGQTWLYMQGGYDPSSNDVVLPVFLEQGGAFPPHFDSSKVTAPAWGIVEFKFTDCNNGTAEYTPNAAAVAAGYGHVPAFPIQRLTTLAGTTCP